MTPVHFTDISFTFADAIGLLFALIMSCSLTWIFVRRNGLDERRVIVLSLVAHLATSQLLLYLQTNIYKISDLWGFYDESTPLLELIRIDPVGYLPRVLGILFHVKNELMPSVDNVTSSASMRALLAIGRWATNDSLWTVFALSAFTSFLGKWGVYAMFRDELTTLNRRTLALATMCIPSVVFWTSGVVKESYAITGLGALCFGTRLLIRGRIRGLMPALVGAVLVGVFKPYVLFPFAVGAIGWLIFERSKQIRAHAPIYLLLGLGVGGILVIVLSAIFPQFSPTSFAEQTAALQEASLAGGDEGAAYAIVEGDRSIAAQIAAAPVAFVTTLARPFPWEAKNPPSLIAAGEMLILTFLLLWALLKGGLPAISAAFTVPAALFCVMLVLVGATAIGLASTNFGTLSRYRAPIIPFYAVLVVQLSQHTTSMLARKRKLGDAAVRSAFGET